jgi:hypothetical protein
MRELYLHFPNTPSWRSAQLKKAQEQLYPVFISCFVFLDLSFSKQKLNILIFDKGNLEIHI